jgi:hypothetical protein
MNMYKHGECVTLWGYIQQMKCVRHNLYLSRYSNFNSWYAGMRWRENGGSCTMRNFIICTHPQIPLGKSSQGEWGGRGMWHAWERRENCTRFWWASPKERDLWEDQGVGGKMGSEWILGRLAWVGVNWIRLSQDRDRWRAVVSAVMNLRVLAPRT